MTDVVLVLTTVPSVELGETMARALVGERLAACVNILPAMTSCYRWQGRVDHASECQLVIKTTQARVPALDARVRALHSYDVPELLVLSVTDGSRAYLSWIADSVTGDSV